MARKNLIIYAHLFRFLLVMLFFFTNCHAQKGIRTKVYSFLTKEQSSGKEFTFKLYMKIDSSINTRTKGLSFYKFTFSDDPNSKTGFVSFSNGKLLFISEHSGSSNNCKNSNIIQTIYDRRFAMSKEICYLGFLGSLKRVRKIDKKFSFELIPTYNFQPPSHSYYVTRLGFSTDNIFPDYISIFDPVLEKEHKVFGY